MSHVASTTDIENATKALHSAQFLVSELRALVKTDSVLLCELAMRDLEAAVEIETHLKRILAGLQG